jgi:hypothetical protein
MILYESAGTYMGVQKCGQKRMILKLKTEHIRQVIINHYCNAVYFKDTGVEQWTLRSFDNTTTNGKHTLVPSGQVLKHLLYTHTIVKIKIFTSGISNSIIFTR